MPGQGCAVASCSSNRFNLKKDGIHLIFHSFPKVNNSVVRKEWITRCNRKERINPNTSAICSLHFIPSDYERDLQNELLGLPMRKVLKKTAVPTLYLDSGSREALIELFGNTYFTIKAAKRKIKHPEKSSLTITIKSEPSEEPSHIIVELTDTLTAPDTFKQEDEESLQNCIQPKYNSNKKIKKE